MFQKSIPVDVCLVIVFIFSVGAADSLTSKGGTLSALKDCIVQSGCNPSDIIEFGDGLDTEKYNKLNYQWNLFHAQKTPLAYFTVRSASDVQAAVRCATSQGVRIVAKGGGHHYEDYGFGDNDALIIDLQLMNEMTVAADNQSLSIGAGALLGQLFYPLLENYGMVTPHGTCPTVGIAGLATGGGYGFLGKLYGLTTDQVLEVEMIDANGAILLANKQSNAELLWAIRGAGSGNFGVITRFTLRTYPAPQIVTIGTKIYPLAEFPDVFLLWQDFVQETYHSKETNTKLSIKDGLVTIEVFYIQVATADVEAGIARINGLLNRFPLTDPGRTTIVTEEYLEFIYRTSHPSDMGITHPSQLANVTRDMFTRRSFSARSYFVREVLNYDLIWYLYYVLEETTRNIEDVTIEMYAFGGATEDSVAIAESSFNHRGNLYLVQAFYNGPVEADPHHPSINWLTRYYITTRDIYRHVESYQNYADGLLHDYLERYYGSDLNRLVRLKRSVDPQNVFHHPQSLPLTLEN